MLKVLSSILCDLDPKVKVIGQKAGICDGVPSTSALVISILLPMCCHIGSGKPYLCIFAEEAVLLLRSMAYKWE